MRKTMRKLTEQIDVATPATIDDPTSLDELKAVYEKEKIGPIYAKKKE